MIAKIGFTYSTIKQKKKGSFTSPMRMNSRKMKRMFRSDFSHII